MAGKPYDLDALRRVRNTVKNPNALRDAARATGEAIGNAAGRVKRTVSVGAGGVREGIRTGYAAGTGAAAAPQPAAPPTPRAPVYGTDRASQRLRAADLRGTQSTPTQSTPTQSAPKPGVSPTGEPVAPGKAVVKSRLRSAFGRWRGGAPAPTAPGGLRARLNGAGAKGFGAFAAGGAILGSLDEDSTARYAKRFGVDEPTGDGSIGDIAKFVGLRVGGFASDLGDRATLGAAGKFYRDNQPEARKPPSGAPPATRKSLAVPGQSPVVGQSSAVPGQSPVVAGRTLRGPIVQDGPNSFTNVPGEPGADIGKPGGGLSVVGSITPDRVQAISQANADLQEAREAASAGISTEQYRNIKANRQLENQANALGLRGRAGAAKLVAGGQGGLDAGNLLSLLGLQQRQGYQDESLGIRRNQLALNQQQVGDQKAASERTATNKYIAQLNSEDPGVASSARGQLLQTFLQNPDSPEGRLLLSQATQALRQRSDEERGPFDALESALSGAPQYPGDLTLDEFSIEPGLFGSGASGTIVKDGGGQVLGNLDDLPPEYAEAIRTIYALRNPPQGIRR